MPFRSLVPRLPAQTLQNFQKIMLAISHIWLCSFWENFSILNKMPILGQAPRRLVYYALQSCPMKKDTKETRQLILK